MQVLQTINDMLELGSYHPFPVLCINKHQCNWYLIRVQICWENKWTIELKSRLFWHQMFLKSFIIIGPFVLAAADPSQHPTSSSCGIMICWYDPQCCWSMFNGGISCLNRILGNQKCHFLDTTFSDGDGRGLRSRKDRIGPGRKMS